VVLGEPGSVLTLVAVAEVLVGPERHGILRMALADHWSDERFVCHRAFVGQGKVAHLVHEAVQLAEELVCTEVIQREVTADSLLRPGFLRGLREAGAKPGNLGDVLALVLDDVALHVRGTLAQESFHLKQWQALRTVILILVTHLPLVSDEAVDVPDVDVYLAELDQPFQRVDASLRESNDALRIGLLIALCEAGFRVWSHRGKFTTHKFEDSVSAVRVASQELRQLHDAADVPLVLVFNCTCIEFLFVVRETRAFAERHFGFAFLRTLWWF